MKYIRTSEEFAPCAGFLHRPEKPGVTTIVAGPPEIDGPDKTGSELNQFPCERIQMSIHRWPPGKAHGSHHHKHGEQLYSIFFGEAEITVDDKKKSSGQGVRLTCHPMLNTTSWRSARKLSWPQ